MPRKITGPCECGVGVDYSGPAPRVIKCAKSGEHRQDVGLQPFGVIACDDCYRVLKQAAVPGMKDPGIKVGGAWEHEVERQREALVRTLGCPQCGSMSGEKCVYIVSTGRGESNEQHSHTPRYLAAVDAGLVPPFPT